MKLRNKLIPIFSVAAATTVAAPLMSSCGNVELTSMDMIDVLHGYTPSCNRAEGATNLTTAQVKDIYIQDVKANPNVMIQDLAWYESLMIKYRLYDATHGKGNTSFINELEDLYGLQPADPEDPKSNFTMIPMVAKFGMSDIKIQDVKLVNPNTDKEETINTISMKFNYQFEYEIVADCCYGVDRYQANRVATVSLTSEYKNIPFDVRWDTEYGTWMVEPTGWYYLTSGEKAKTDTTWILTRLTNYSLDFDMKAVFTDTIKDYNGNTDTYTYDESRAGRIDSYSSFRAWIQGNKGREAEKAIRQYIFNFGSYHLYDVMGPRWSCGSLGYLSDYVKDSMKQTDTTQAQCVLTNQICYSWSYAEAEAYTCPTSKEGIAAKLLNKEEEVTFPIQAYNEESDQWDEIGSVTLSDYDSDGCGKIYESDCQMLMSFKATFNFNNAEELKLYLASYNDNSKVKFEIPANTTFKFETYTYDEKGSIVSKELDCKIEDAITCFWSATTGDNE